MESFFAESVTIDSNGSVINSAKLYVTKDAMRIDGLMGGDIGGGSKPDLSMMVLKKQNKTYLYNHDKKLVFQEPAEEKDLMDVIIGTQSTLREVFDDYRRALASAGWEDGGSFMQGDVGMMTMRKGDQTVQITAADKPAAMEGDYKFYYDVQYSAPPQP